MDDEYWVDVCGCEYFVKFRVIGREGFERRCIEFVFEFDVWFEY